jgi:hypothetical protein
VRYKVQFIRYLLSQIFEAVCLGGDFACLAFIYYCLGV